MLREQRHVTVFIQLCPDLSGFGGHKLRFRRGESRLGLGELGLRLLILSGRLLTAASNGRGSI